MGLFFSISDKELLLLRNKIFLDHGVPALNRNGFQKSTFSTAWYGRNNLKDFTYELFRLAPASTLEIIVVHIPRGDRFIQIFLNIFRLQPDLKSLDELKGGDGLQYALPPNSRSDMRLGLDDIKGPPYRWRTHKLRSYFTKKGLAKRTEELARHVESDLDNIDGFVSRWHEMHKPLTTTWEGVPIP